MFWACTLSVSYRCHSALGKSVCCIQTVGNIDNIGLKSGIASWDSDEA